MYTQYHAQSHGTSLINAHGVQGDGQLEVAQSLTPNGQSKE